MYVFSDKKLGERITIITLISIYTIFLFQMFFSPPVIIIIKPI